MRISEKMQGNKVIIKHIFILIENKCIYIILLNITANKLFVIKVIKKQTLNK